MWKFATLLALCATCGPDHDELPFFLGAGPQPPTEAREQAPGGTLPMQPRRKIEFDTDEGTWMSLDVSPDGRTILFDLLGDLYALDAEKGGEARAVTTGMAFDTQPAFAPDGSRIAFLSDRSGNENLWVAKPDGSDAQQISFLDDNTVFVSPSWSADGRFLYVSRFKPDLQAFELWKYTADGDPKPELIVKSKANEDTPHDGRVSALGAVESRDGRYLYFARRTGSVFKEDVATLSIWEVRRRDLKTGQEELVASNTGSAMRPVLSPDGRMLVYAARSDAKTGLRAHDLETGAERWLLYPIQRDDQEGTTSRDLVPRYAFTPDGKALLLAYDRKIHRFDMAAGVDRVLPFQAHVSLDLGPNLRRSIRDETGPVRARIIQNPLQSPDGKRVAFAALAKIYVMDAASGAVPKRLTPQDQMQGDEPEFQPSWSPDGRLVTYVTWRARGGGKVWVAPVDGSEKPKAIGTVSDSFYSNPVFTPDGKSVLVLRSSNYARMHVRLELGLTRQAQLVRLPLDGSQQQEITRGQIGGPPHFTAEQGVVYLNFVDGLHRVALDGSGHKRVLTVKGPGYYFREGLATTDDLRLSHDGKWALAQIAQQLHLIAVPQGGEAAPTIDLTHPTVAHRKLTRVGADFFDWADGGRTITWAVGSTFYRLPLEGDGDERTAQSFQAIVEVPRDVPRGALVLRGGTAITMKGTEVVRDADIVVVDNRIQAVGKRGTVQVPAGATIRNIAGKYVTPGFIDTHAHWGEVRRGVLDVDNWGFATNLAYGVTAGLDVSSLSIDVFSYQDLIDAGVTTGLRTYSTGTAIFSFNDFQSEQEAVDVLTRYRAHYRTENLKHYRTGNRRVRQWMATAAEKVGLQMTAEGALDMKLDLSQVIDGMSNEHALTAYPLGRDVIELFARTRASYTMTMQLSTSSPPGQNYFAERMPVRGDAKAERFFPHFVIEGKWTRKSWYDPGEYVFGKVAEGGAAIQRAGGLLGIGSHSEIEGLGLHWEMWAHAQGGMTPAEVLHAATIGSAETIGHQDELGSLEPGKFADLVILDRNPLEKIENTLAIANVMKNGRLYDGATLDEVWPRQKKAVVPWYADDRAPAAQQQGEKR
jgi:Tol biopolymer transport system component